MSKVNDQCYIFPYGCIGLVRPNIEEVISEDDLSIVENAVEYLVSYLVVAFGSITNHQALADFDYIVDLRTRSIKVAGFYDGRKFLIERSF